MVAQQANPLSTIKWPQVYLKHQQQLPAGHGEAGGGRGAVLTHSLIDPPAVLHVAHSNVNSFHIAEQKTCLKSTRETSIVDNRGTDSG